MQPATTKIESVLRDINFERHRQERLKATGKFKHTCADPEMPDSVALSVLVEEVGEVAREVNDAYSDSMPLAHRTDLREELIQVAAVAVAWAEKLG